MSLYDVSVPTFKRTLTSLKKILVKGEEHANAKGIDLGVLLNSRLIADMLPLTRQVQIATDSAKRGAARLAGVEPPVFEDTETSMDELYQRIDRTIAFLDTLKPEQFVGAETRIVELPTGGTTIKLDGTTFLTAYAMANFFFHVTTGYNILRSNGVNIGKMDFLGSP